MKGEESRVKSEGGMMVFGKFILILRDGGLWRGCVRMTMLRMLRITKLTVAARGPFVIDFE